MKIKHLTYLTILAAAMPLAEGLVMAQTVTLDTEQGVYPGLGGGEFTAFTSQSGNYLANYNTVDATYNGGFETFCLETGVDFSPGTQYYYTLGTVTQPKPANGTGSALSLTVGAAYLYYEFASGGFGSQFDYTYGSSGRLADDNLLQAAIWALQGGQSYGNYPSGTAGNPYYTDAINAYGSLAAAQAAYGGADVQVLQMWTTYSGGVYSGAAQNQLVLTGGGPPPEPTVPDGGMTVVLLGGALIGVQVMRRKLVA